ncbi:MAG: TIGR03087 family PEP-CTERM/XrtA system glycosyltransferase [Nitrosomonas sp.]|nr:TIGR03087 family PEP-CTERM/XrtA system glycosyltransferase [Nitrosomonas sp.]
MQALLYLTHRIPYPPNKGDKIRSFHILQHLSQHYRVFLGTFVDDEQDWQHVDKVRSYCEDTCIVGIDPLVARARSLFALLGNDPLTLAYYRHTKLQQWVAQIFEQQAVSVSVVFSAAMAQYVDHNQHGRRIIDFVDIDSDKWRQYAISKPWPFSWIYRREADCLFNYERRIACEFDNATFVSEKEASLFRQLAPECAQKTTFFNNGVDTSFFSPGQNYPNPYPAGIEVLVFTGAMDYWANIDAVDWFARHIFPIIRARRPNTWFYIVGAKPGKTVQLLANLPGICITGMVADIRPYLQHAVAAVAPLRIARGIQNKVLEAMAMQKPVIVSPQALEGINAIDGEELLVANNETEFSDQALRILENWNRAILGQAARNRIMADYTWQNSLSRLDTMLETIFDTEARR